MKRRQFLQQSTLATLALMAPRVSYAGSNNAPADKLWVFIDANGAWDPTFFCDPQIHPAYVSDDVFTAADIGINEFGVSFAAKEKGKKHYMVGPDAGLPFYTKYADKLFVINGFDAQTNNHRVGSQSMWSGKLGDGNPSLGALIAAAHAQEDPNKLPLAFVSTGGYDRTNGLGAATRVGATKPLLKLTQTNLKNEKASQSFYHHPDMLEAIRQAQAKRTARLIEEQGLPQIKAGLKRLDSARAAGIALDKLLVPLGVLPEVNANDSPLLPGARIALAAMQAGICRCANLSMAGFDTHSGHNLIASGSGGHRLRLQELLVAIDYVWSKAKELQLDDKLVVVIGSDFGRTKYNNPKAQDGDPPPNVGKDHWPVTSLMVMGNANDISPGVIGETFVDELKSGVVAKQVVNVNGKLEVTDDADNKSATLMRQVHVHHALRCIAGIKNHDLSKRYPLFKSSDFPLPVLPKAPGWETA